MNGKSSGTSGGPKRPRKKKSASGQLAQRRRAEQDVLRKLNDIKRTINGLGGYKEALYDTVKHKDFEGNFAADYGERLGQAIAGDVGGVLGEGLQSTLRLFGFGDYKMPKKNSLLAALKAEDLDALAEHIPEVVNSATGDCVIVRHKEYIGEVYTGTGTPTAFSLQTQALHPANESVFPWLSSVAACFQEWEPRGMLFIMKSECSEYAANLALGTMFAAAQYDSQAPAFVNKQEILEYDFGRSCKPSKSLILPIECAPFDDVLTHLYVPENGVIPAGADPKFYQLGTLNWGSQGNPTPGADIAEAWITYEIAFYKPRLSTGGSLNLNAPAAHVQFTGASGAAWMGTAQTLVAGSTLPVTISGAGTVVNFPAGTTAGNYLIVWTLKGTSATIAVGSGPALVGATAQNLFYGDTFNNFELPLGAVASTIWCYVLLISINNPTGGPVTITTATNWTLPTASTGDLWIVPYPASIVS